MSRVHDHLDSARAKLGRADDPFAGPGVREALVGRAVSDLIRAVRLLAGPRDPGGELLLAAREAIAGLLREGAGESERRYAEGVLARLRQAGS